MKATPERVIKILAAMIVEVITEAGDRGAPGGHIYAALSAHGFSLNAYQSLMDGLVRVGKLRRSGDCYFKGAGRVA